MSAPRYGLIEAGGTKFVLGVADTERTILARERIPTTTPAETLGAAVEWFAAQGADYAAFGIASFGPLDLDPGSPAFGCVRPTPKPHWSGASLIAPFKERFGVPVAIDTDVNGAALAEALWGAGADLGSVLYLTIGTGIGGGFCSDGHLLRGLSHPEMGHIRMPRHPEDLDFVGTCPFHGDCLEGLACGPAVIARWGQSLSELPEGHPGKRIIAWYIGAGDVPDHHGARAHRAGWRGDSNARPARSDPHRGADGERRLYRGQDRRVDRAARAG